MICYIFQGSWAGKEIPGLHAHMPFICFTILLNSVFHFSVARTLSPVLEVVYAFAFRHTPQSSAASYLYTYLFLILAQQQVL